jgi:hypothetical protein
VPLGMGLRRLARRKREQAGRPGTLYACQRRPDSTRLSVPCSRQIGRPNFSGHGLGVLKSGGWNHRVSAAVVRLLGEETDPSSSLPTSSSEAAAQVTPERRLSVLIYSVRHYCDWRDALAINCFCAVGVGKARPIPWGPNGQVITRMTTWTRCPRRRGGGPPSLLLELPPLQMDRGMSSLCRRVPAIPLQPSARKSRRG